MQAERAKRRRILSPPLSSSFHRPGTYRRQPRRFFEFDALSRSLALSLTFRLLSLSRSLSLSLSLFEFEHSAADPKKRRPGCGVAGRVSGTSFAAFAELAALSSEAAANAKKKSGGKQGEGEAVGESTSFASVAAALSTSIAMLSRPQGPLSRSLAFV